MRRRDFIAGLGGSLASLPLMTQAQQLAQMHRIAHLASGTEAARRPFIDAFKTGMRELSYVEGQNFSFDTRFDDGNFERLTTKTCGRRSREAFVRRRKRTCDHKDEKWKAERL